MTAPAHLQVATFGRGGLTRQRTASFGKNPAARGKLLVVAVDPSNLAQRSIKLAAWLMNAADRDKVKLITVSMGDHGASENGYQHDQNKSNQPSVLPHGPLPFARREEIPILPYLGGG